MNILNLFIFNEAIFQVFSTHFHDDSQPTELQPVQTLATGTQHCGKTTSPLKVRNKRYTGLSSTLAKVHCRWVEKWKKIIN